MIVKALSSTHQQIPDQLTIPILLVSVILAYLLTILSNLLLQRKVTNINMIESLKGVLAYKPTPEEDAQWGYRWAFIDKEGKVRKFVKKENADLIYKQIFG